MSHCIRLPDWASKATRGRSVQSVPEPAKAEMPLYRNGSGFVSRGRTQGANWIAEGGAAKNSDLTSNSIIFCNFNEAIKVALRRLISDF